MICFLSQKENWVISVDNSGSWAITQVSALWMTFLKKLESEVDHSIPRNVILTHDLPYTVSGRTCVTDTVTLTRSPLCSLGLWEFPSCGSLPLQGGLLVRGPGAVLTHPSILPCKQTCQRSTQIKLVDYHMIVFLWSATECFKFLLIFIVRSDFILRTVESTVIEEL